MSIILNMINEMKYPLVLVLEKEIQLFQDSDKGDFNNATDSSTTLNIVKTMSICCSIVSDIYLQIHLESNRSRYLLLFDQRNRHNRISSYGLDKEAKVEFSIL